MKGKNNVNNEQEVLEQEEIKEQAEAEASAQANEPAEEPGPQQKYEELYDKHLRVLAEYENYKRRTQKEKDEIYAFAQASTIEQILPVLDNLERALLTEDSSPFKDGVAMIVKQLLETLEKMGVTPICAVGKPFDPNLHNAVMHIEDENFGESIVTEEFQKGYLLKDKVIRHSMVKVAN